MLFKILLIDFEGFGVLADFSIRELSLIHYECKKLHNKSYFSPPPSAVDCQSFRQTKSWQKLTGSERRQNLYVSKHIHGLAYQPTFNCLVSTQVKSYIIEAASTADIVLCKGYQKYIFLASFLQKPIIELEQVGCEKFISSPETKKYFESNFCSEPAHQYNSGSSDKILSHCAGRKATYFVDWIYANNKSAELIELHLKNSISGLDYILQKMSDK